MLGVRAGFAPGTVSLFTLDLCDACTSLTATFCPRVLKKLIGLNDDNSLAGAVLSVVCRSSCLAMGRQPCDARLAVSWVQTVACCSLQHFGDYHGIAASVGIFYHESPATLRLSPASMLILRPTHRPPAQLPGHSTHHNATSSPRVRCSCASRAMHAHASAAAPTSGKRHQ